MYPDGKVSGKMEYKKVKNKKKQMEFARVVDVTDTMSTSNTLLKYQSHVKAWGKQAKKQQIIINYIAHGDKAPFK